MGTSYSWSIDLGEALWNVPACDIEISASADGDLCIPDLVEIEPKPTEE